MSREPKFALNKINLQLLPRLDKERNRIQLLRAQLRVSAEKIAAYSTAADGKLGLSLLEHQFDGQSYRSAIAFASSVDGLETLL